MSVVGLCVVFIPGWVGAGKVAEPIGSGVPVWAVSSSAGSRGGRVYISAVQVGLLLCVGWLSPLFEFMKQWLP